jgi:hypothetical protein
MSSGASDWEQHLRSGGSTPWSEFSAADAPPSGPGLASAVHLELLRRLDSGLPAFGRLADLVLATPTPGRGSVDVPLASSAATAYGAPAVDPAELPAEELLRLAVAVLAALVATPTVPPVAVGQPRPWARRFRVSGVPVLREQVRAALLAKGWRETARGGTHFVLGAPLADGFAQVWAHRVSQGSTVPWPRLWKRHAARDRLPGALRFDELCERARGTGGRMVPVIGTGARAAALLAEVHRIEVPGPPDLVAIEVTRRLNGVLVTRLRREARRHLVPVVADVVGRSTEPITALAVPRAQRGWAGRQSHPGGPGEAGYPRPEDSAGLPVRVPADRSLELALAAIGRGWTRQQGSEGVEA